MHKAIITKILIATVLSYTLLFAEENSIVMNYDDSMKIVSDHINNKEFQKAISILDDMEHFYPKNIEVLSRRAALYKWTNSFQASITEYEKLYLLTKDPLYVEEINKINDMLLSLQYQQKKNFVSLQNENYSYGEKQAIERDTTLQVGLKIEDITLILSGASINRYNSIDQQIGIEAYSTLGKKEDRRWGYLALYQSPSPYFLPQSDISGALYQGIFEQSEISFGYRHMNFSGKGINIIKPGISFPLPWKTLRFGEELFLVPDTHSYAAVSTFSYDPSYRFHSYYTFTTGNSAETFRDETDIRRVKTFSHAVGGTWRFDPSWAIGTEITDGYRSQLYRRTGWKILLKYFW